MIAVLSATENDFYAFPLPLVVWSWHKLGIRSIVFVPENTEKKVEIAKKYCGGMAEFHTFKCEERKEATFAQTSRLFGATITGVNHNEILITGDADLAVFGNEFEQLKDSQVRVIGADLLSEEMNQFPMCFVGMPAGKWREIFGLDGKTLQQALDETVGQLQSETFRGDFWGYDQWYCHNRITKSGVNVFKNSRAKMPERFANRRYDRDDMFLLDRLSLDTIDYHLPRPAFEETNLNQILTVFRFHYPNDDLTWMREYQQEYKKLL